MSEQSIGLLAFFMANNLLNHLNFVQLDLLLALSLLRG